VLVELSLPIGRVGSSADAICTGGLQLLSASCMHSEGKCMVGMLFISVSNDCIDSFRTMVVQADISV
jgi:hypothetical protein